MLDDDFGSPTLLIPTDDSEGVSTVSQRLGPADSEDEDMEEVSMNAPATIDLSLREHVPPSTVTYEHSLLTRRAPKKPPISLPPSSGEENTVEIVPTIAITSNTLATTTLPTNSISAGSSGSRLELSSMIREKRAPFGTPTRLPNAQRKSSNSVRFLPEVNDQQYILPQLVAPSVGEESSSDDFGESWSRPTSPTTDPASQAPQHAKVDEDWDAAQEIDPQAEENEYAQFISQVRGRNLEEVRREIDDEIRILNEQKKIAMRDSEDITQQMISQIMVRARAPRRSIY